VDSFAPPLTPVYQLEREAVREIANRTVHSLMHLTWVQSASNGDYELQMAVLVKANGRLGRLYMAAIAPFRYLIVYPAVTRHWERAWRDHGRLERGQARTAADILPGTQCAWPDSWLASARTANYPGVSEHILQRAGGCPPRRQGLRPPGRPA